jgi:hypothetical protein
MGVGTMLGRVGAMVCPWIVLIGHREDDTVSTQALFLLAFICWSATACSKSGVRF